MYYTMDYYINGVQGKRKARRVIRLDYSTYRQMIFDASEKQGCVIKRQANYFR